MAEHKGVGYQSKKMKINPQVAIKWTMSLFQPEDKQLQYLQNKTIEKQWTIPTQYSSNDDFSYLHILGVLGAHVRRRGALGQRQQAGGGEGGHAAHASRQRDGRHGWGAKRLECNLRETL